MTVVRSLVSASVLCASAGAFSIRPRRPAAPTMAGPPGGTTALGMGLFDGVREAFSAPALERSRIDSERETPIDRWMGWSVASENQPEAVGQPQSLPSDFVDAMDGKNYVTVELRKPMGIVFEENDSEYGGIYVQSIKEGSAAESDGRLRTGDQLVAVDGTKVCGEAFDEALGRIVDAAGDATRLIFFRGSAKQFYGPTGASQAWIDEFIA